MLLQRIFLENLQSDINSALDNDYVHTTQMMYFYRKMCSFLYDYTDVGPAEATVFVQCVKGYVNCISKCIEIPGQDSSMVKQFCKIIGEIPKLGAKNEYLQEMSKIIFDKIVDLEVPLWFTKELVANFKLALGHFSKEVLSKFIESQVPFLCKVADALEVCGDFTYQFLMLETIFYICSPKQISEFSVELFPESEILQNAFKSIRNDNFIVAVRKFLNLVNWQKDRIFSIKCECAFLDSRSINAPQGCEESDLWVDFNTGSATVSMFCDANFSGSLFSNGKNSSTDLEKLVTINTTDVKNIVISRWLEPGFPVSKGSVICFTLKKAVRAECLKLAILNGSSLKQLEENVLPKMFQEKVKRLSPPPVVQPQEPKMSISSYSFNSMVLGAESLTLPKSAVHLEFKNRPTPNSSKELACSYLLDLDKSVFKVSDDGSTTIEKKDDNVLHASTHLTVYVLDFIDLTIADNAPDLSLAGSVQRIQNDHKTNDAEYSEKYYSIPETNTVIDANNPTNESVQVVQPKDVEPASEYFTALDVNCSSNSFSRQDECLQFITKNTPLEKLIQMLNASESSANLEENMHCSHGEENGLLGKKEVKISQSKNFVEVNKTNVRICYSTTNEEPAEEDQIPLDQNLKQLPDNANKEIRKISEPFVGKYSDQFEAEATQLNQEGRLHIGSLESTVDSKKPKPKSKIAKSKKNLYLGNQSNSSKLVKKKPSKQPEKTSHTEFKADLNEEISNQNNLLVEQQLLQSFQNFEITPKAELVARTSQENGLPDVTARKLMEKLKNLKAALKKKSDPKKTLENDQIEKQFSKIAVELLDQNQNLEADIVQAREVANEQHQSAGPDITSAGLKIAENFPVATKSPVIQRSQQVSEQVRDLSDRSVVQDLKKSCKDVFTKLPVDAEKETSAQEKEVIGFEKGEFSESANNFMKVVRIKNVEQKHYCPRNTETSGREDGSSVDSVKNSTSQTLPEKQFSSGHLQQEIISGENSQCNLVSQRIISQSRPQYPKRIHVEEKKSGKPAKRQKRLSSRKLYDPNNLSYTKLFTEDDFDEKTSIYFKRALEGTKTPTSQKNIQKKILKKKVKPDSENAKRRLLKVKKKQYTEMNNNIIKKQSEEDAFDKILTSQEKSKNQKLNCSRKTFSPNYTLPARTNNSFLSLVEALRKSSNATFSSNVIKKRKRFENKPAKKPKLLPRKQKSSSSSLLSELCIEKEPVKTAVELCTSTPKITVVSNILIKEGLINNCDKKSKSSAALSETSTVKIPFELIDTKHMKNQIPVGRLSPIAELITSPLGLEVTNPSVVGPSGEGSQSSLTDLSGATLRKEEILSWIQRGMSEEEANVYKNVLEIYMRSLASLNKTLLFEIRGPIHPKLIPLYSLLSQIDESFENYFKEN